MAPVVDFPAELLEGFLVLGMGGDVLDLAGVGGEVVELFGGALGEGEREGGFGFFGEEVGLGVGFIDVAVFADGPVVSGVADGPAVWFEVVEIEVIRRAETADGVAEVALTDVGVAFALEEHAGPFGGAEE